MSHLFSGIWLSSEDRANSDSELLAARAALPNAFAVGDLTGLLWLASNRRQFGGIRLQVHNGGSLLCHLASVALRGTLWHYLRRGRIGYLCEVHGALQQANCLRTPLVCQVYNSAMFSKRF